jgi:transcriptional regulator with XRE-family HTH domain
VRANRGPTLRSQLLGQHLRDLRDEAGLTLKDVADYAQRDPSSMSRLEAGIHPARVPDVLAYLSVCRISDVHRRESLVQLAKDAWQTGLWDRYTEGALKKLMDLAWLEARAVEIRNFQALVLPGLLQVPAYAEAVIRSSDHQMSAATIERWLEVRMARQEILTREESPVRLTTILDESVLHRQVGGVDVMRTQMEHLIKLIEGGSVTVLVLLWSSGAHASPEGCFDVLFMEKPYTAVGYAETPAGAVFIERDEVNPLVDRHVRLSNAALNRADSLAFLRDLTSGVGADEREGQAAPGGTG